MKKYICDICGRQMPDERCLIAPLKRFDGNELFSLKLKDNCGYRDVDICVDCEDRIRKSLNLTVIKIRAGKDGMECEHIDNEGDCLCNWSGCNVCMGPNSCSGFSRKEEFMKSPTSDDELIKKCKYLNKDTGECTCVYGWRVGKKCESLCPSFAIIDDEKESMGCRKDIPETYYCAYD